MYPSYDSDLLQNLVTLSSAHFSFNPADKQVSDSKNKASGCCVLEEITARVNMKA